ncbi:MAG: HXXEE domain-containing protein [Mesorhizobium sp.]|nr:HXXEE domain-containing protein [Mesorhizobium sp.]
MTGHGVERLFNYWTYGGFLAGIMMLVLTPLFASDWSPAFTAVFLLLPVYMLHQYEEHDGDRFRTYVNRMVGHGAEVLTPAAVFAINIGAVWALDVVVIYLAWRVDLGLGLIAVYLMLVNALVHIAGAIRSRAYNPGLVTALVLFLPFGGYAWWRIETSGAATPADHMIGLAVGIAAHVLIVAYALRRRSLLRGH